MNEDKLMTGQHVIMSRPIKPLTARTVISEHSAAYLESVAGSKQRLLTRFNPQWCGLAVLSAYSF